MAATAPTPNAISSMFRGGSPKQPAVQLIEIKPVVAADPNAPKRIKCVRPLLIFSPPHVSRAVCLCTGP